MMNRYNVDADKGMIHDMDGIGHKVGIKLVFSEIKISSRRRHKNSRGDGS